MSAVYCNGIQTKVSRGESTKPVARGEQTGNEVCRRELSSEDTTFDTHAVSGKAAVAFSLTFN